MRAVALVCLLTVSAYADSNADAYTIGQVAAGIPYARAVASGQPGYIAYTSYPAGYNTNLVVPGSPVVAAPGVHYLGKREAEADADAYTIGQVAAGLPYANAIATGHAHNPGYIAYASYPNSYAGYPSIYSGVHYLGKREAEAEADAYTIGQVAAGLPWAQAVASGRAHNPGYIAYTSYPAGYNTNLVVPGSPVVAAPGVHYLGKREADADAYTIGQVYAGLPYANAIATGHAHNPGYIAYTSYPNTYTGYPAVHSGVYYG